MGQRKGTAPSHPIFDALFLDRDGVINKQIIGDYVRNAGQFEFLNGVLEAIRVITPFFRRIIIITNQRGVGKGLMTRVALNCVNSYMVEKIKDAGGRIDKIYSCTDMDENSPNRKPNTGMALMARRDFPDIDFKKSIMVGDSVSDVDFANNAGIPAILVGGKYSREEMSGMQILAHYDSLKEMSVRLFASLK
ncbi:MAG: HAD-IIIA family hydrolase [Bacteroidales bacterium]|nr:HAD-IIIA family hydrolase [Bacteroidales bacterium]MCI2121493.1 HAD-IIIA family hydrolase [Bacteroidales bacterium]MCI2145142.1 HAD-IIIA family hydrolase [Bacteroidales bacterium]